jgi:sugar/nucleoside kinase (ribokinase family)
MIPEPPSPALHLLVVGGLTIDRFADGASVPGGSVTHVSRAVAARGRRVGVLTAAGPEPEANRGVAELRALCERLDVATYPATTTFRHRDDGAARRLWLERNGGHVALPTDAGDRIPVSAVLYAPIAGEVDADALDVWDRSLPRAGILQGWLRTTLEGTAVTPLSLASLDATLVAALSGLDLLVASREDLVADASTPDDQLTALRETCGPAPALIVTDATDGLWLDVAGTRQHAPVPRVVQGAPTVGAGDILAAFVVMPDADPSASWRTRAIKAMDVVAEELDARKDR